MDTSDEIKTTSIEHNQNPNATSGHQERQAKIIKVHHQQDIDRHHAIETLSKVPRKNVNGAGVLQYVSI